MVCVWWNTRPGGETGETLDNVFDNTGFGIALIDIGAGA